METKLCDCTPAFIDHITHAKNSMPTDDDISEVLAFYKVLADKTRLSILYALKEQELCAGDIAVLLNMTKSAVSHQLAVMRNMHQIKSRREGKYVFYSLDDEHIVDIIEEAYIHMKHIDSSMIDEKHS